MITQVFIYKTVIRLIEFEDVFFGPYVSTNWSGYN